MKAATPHSIAAPDFELGQPWANHQPPEPPDV